jgi:arylsulfatase A-like enzyme
MTTLKRLGVILLTVVIAAAGGHHLLKGRWVSRPNVLWITMDSLRADHLGCAGYERARTPNIDALAGEGTLFAQAIAQASYTHISVPSMITGKVPAFAGVRTPAAHLDSSQATLAEVLREEEYLTCGIVMRWNESFNQGFEWLHPASRCTRERTRLCLEALNRLDGHPFFIWLYYWDPHLPYDPPEEFMRIYEPQYSREEGKWEGRPKPTLKNEELRDATGFYGGTVLVLNRVNEGRIVLTAMERQHLVNLYDAEIALVDSRIKEVVGRIKELGLWENTMVVLNADHGEAFGEHDRYYHGHTLYEEEVRVPLIVKPPGSQAGSKVIEGPVRNLDIMPTILDYCGIPPPQHLNGQSLRPFIENDQYPNFSTSLETVGFWKGMGSEFQLVGYRQDGYKLIYDLVAEERELYHLDRDAGETHNLAAFSDQSADIAGREVELSEDLLQTLAFKHLGDLKISFNSLKMDRATQQRLKALGYID